MKKALVLIGVCLVFSGCGRSFYYTNQKDRNATEIKIDANSKYYIRKLYKVVDEDKLRLSLSSANPFRGLKIDSDSNPVFPIIDFRPDIFKIIEIEHLYIFRNNVIYITTTPSKYQNDLTKRYLLEDNAINGYWFNTFFFGTVEKDDSVLVCRFEEKESTAFSLWIFDKIENNKLELRAIEKYDKRSKFISTILVAPTIPGSLQFVPNEKEAFSIQFKRPDVVYLPNVPLPKLDAIHYSKSGKKKDKFSLYMTFDQSLSGHDKIIHFKNVRIKNNPDCIKP